MKKLEYRAILFEIEFAMEKWHKSINNDSKTLEDIATTLTSIGMLESILVSKYITKKTKANQVSDN
jgi:ribosome recycling factor